MLRIKASHVFAMSNNSTISISNNHLFWVSTWLHSLWNVLPVRALISTVKTRIMRLWRLSVIKWIRLKMMSTRRMFIHIWNLVLVFLIIRWLNCLWNTIYQFVLLKETKFRTFRWTYLLNWLITYSATVTLHNRALVLIVLTGVSCAATTNIVASNLWASTIYKFSFSLLLSLVYVCLSVTFRSLLLYCFWTTSTQWSWFRRHHLLLMLFNRTSFFLRNAVLVWLLLNNLNSCVLW